MPGELVACNITSFSQGLPATFAIEALENSEVVCISAVYLEALYTQLPKLERFFRILFKNGFAPLPAPAYPRAFEFGGSTVQLVQQTVSNADEPGRAKAYSQLFRYYGCIPEYDPEKIADYSAFKITEPSPVVQR